MTNDDVQWLDDQERDAWIGLMTVLLRVPAALDRQLRSAAGITHFDYQVMVILSEADDRTLRMSHLADLTEGSLPRLSQVVARHEKAGWIVRHPDPDDGRSTLATLTDAGFDTLVAAAPGHVEEVRRLVFDPLSKAQIGQLARIADSIMAGPASGSDPRPERKHKHEDKHEDKH